MKKADLIREWMDYARNDLRAAEYLTNLHPQPVEIICFHCQQAAESPEGLSCFNRYTSSEDS